MTLPVRNLQMCIIETQCTSEVVSVIVNFFVKNINECSSQA